MSAQAELVERVRMLVADQSVAREVAMFGGRAFMVHEKMIVSVMKSGDLLVRVANERHDELLERPGAQQAEMGAGRAMGSGWIKVGAPAIANDPDLTFWLGVALEHNRAATGGVTD